MRKIYLCFVYCFYLTGLGVGHSLTGFSGAEFNLWQKGNPWIMWMTWRKNIYNPMQIYKRSSLQNGKNRFLYFETFIMGVHLLTLVHCKLFCSPKGEGTKKIQRILCFLGNIYFGNNMMSTVCRKVVSVGVYDKSCLRISLPSNDKACKELWHAKLNKSEVRGTIL